MTVPSPTSRKAHTLRIRSKSFLLRPGLSCFNVILFLITAQLIAMFLMAVTVGNPLGMEAWRSNDGFPATILTSSQDDDKEARERKRRLAQFEVGDDRQNRVLYPPSSADSSTGTGTSEGAAAAAAAAATAGAEDEEQPSATDDVMPAALDDYGSRKHFPKRDSYSFSSSPYLVVGGSDGSGTRAVVDQLVELGAFFHVEDRRTMDVHGSEMFHKGGWPPLVNMIMNVTHSANYELKDLPKDVRERAITEMKKLKKSIDKRAESKLKHITKKEGGGTDHFATATSVGWKAPIGMVLLPVIRAVFGQVKFLHVVRDGRDVSLSDNQSPVKKFYNTYYGISHPTSLFEEKNLTTYAMQLWNDMNQQVMEWGRSHSDGETFDYLTIRTEDLVNPETKLDALLQLADFVGSKKSVAELCCLSQLEVKDMGKSAKTPRDPNDLMGVGRFRRGRGRWGGGPLDYMGMGMSKEDFMEDLLRGPRDYMADGPGGDFLDRLDPDRMEAYRRRRSQRNHDGGSEDDLENKKAEREEERLRRNIMMEQKREEIRERHRHLPKRDYHPIANGLQEMMKRRKARQLAKHDNNNNNNNDHNNNDNDNDNNQDVERRQLLELANFPSGGENREARAGHFRGRPHPRFGGRPFNRRDRFKREAPEQVKARYGKWVKALEDKPELSAKLHELGSTGLQAFGYEPSTTFLDPPDDAFAQQCQVILDENVCTGAPPPEKLDPREGSDCSFVKPKSPGYRTEMHNGMTQYCK